jgi:hypothetical protein
MKDVDGRDKPGHPAKNNRGQLAALAFRASPAEAACRAAGEPFRGAP